MSLTADCWHPSKGDATADDLTPDLEAVWPVTGPWGHVMPTETEAHALAALAGSELVQLGKALGVKLTGRPTIRVVETATHVRASSHPGAAGCRFSVVATAPTIRTDFNEPSTIRKARA